MRAWPAVLTAAVLLSLGTAAPETVVVRNGELSLRALLWRPQGEGPFPAVLFNHGSGAAADPRNPAVLGPVFARRGYVFLYLYRRGAGLSADQGEHSVVLMGRAFEERGQRGRNQVQLELLDTELTDVIAGIAFLRAHPDVDARRIAVAGHSFGGSLSLVLAEREPALRAVVLFGAATGSWDRSRPLRTRLRSAAAGAQAPVLFVYTANEYTVAPAKVLAAQMQRHGRPHRLEIYPAFGATPQEGHDFVHGGVAVWEQDVFAFLDQHVKGGAP